MRDVEWTTANILMAALIEQEELRAEALRLSAIQLQRFLTFEARIREIRESMRKLAS